VPDPRLSACSLWLAACEEALHGRTPQALEAALSKDKQDFEARFELAQHHWAALRFTEAMDALLEILMRDKGWREGLARKAYVAILEVMRRPAPPAGADHAAAKGPLEFDQLSKMAVSSDPVVDAYRRKLSMVVF
jgi:putative thioredoxin